MEKRRPTGRPPISPDSRRSRNVVMRVTPEERDTLKAVAASRGVTVTTLLRELGLSAIARRLIDHGLAATSETRPDGGGSRMIA